jgi:hypothetical protein
MTEEQIKYSIETKELKLDAWGHEVFTLRQF